MSNPLRTLSDFREYEARDKRQALSNRAWRQSPRGRRATADTHRANKYGLTPAQYDALVLESCGRCSLCAEPADLVIDHCHRAGTVRALLCETCNIALGGIERDGRDAQAWLASASRYFSAHGQHKEVCGGRGELTLATQVGSISSASR